MLVLVLLLLLTATLFYNTIDLQKRQVIEEMKATSLDLKSSSIEYEVSSSISPVFNKVLNDASLKVIRSGFFNGTGDVINYLRDNTEYHITKYLDNVSKRYSKEGYNLTYSFHISNITMVDGFTFKVDYTFSYTLSNGNIKKTKNIESSQNITVKTILDAYHYLKPTYIMPIYIYNPYNYSLTDFKVKIVLNNSNFNFSIDPNGTGLRFLDEECNFISYWIEYWNYTEDGTDNDNGTIWVKISRLEAYNSTTVYLVSTYPKISESNSTLLSGLPAKGVPVYVSGNLSRIYPLIYISPGRANGTHYGEGMSHNPYFVEDPSGRYPSIVDMLAGEDRKKFGYGIKLTGLPLSSVISK